MVNRLRRGLVLGVPAAFALRPFAAASQAPLRIEVTEGVVEPMLFAAPRFVPDSPDAAEMARQITDLVIADLTGSGLFREIPPEAHIAEVGNFEAAVDFTDWRAIEAQALITGAVGVSGESVQVRFRLWDVFAQSALGEGLQFDGSRDGWRRMGHKVADVVYSRLTGEGAYFDSRVAYVAVSGPKASRRKQLAIMDYDGANAAMLTDGTSLVLTPRMGASARRILYTSYAEGAPRIFLLETGGRPREVLEGVEGMTFAPRFSPDEGLAVMSLSREGGSDLYVVDLANGGRLQLTESGAIDTAPCFSADGEQIVFESDRSGSQQLYVMPASGGEARRISFGEGRYATPVWSPLGDRIAFTKILGGQFHIGVMAADGSDERLLTSSYIDEGPTWSPNGRVVMFFREAPGEGGGPQIHTVDISGRNLQKVPTTGFAADPSWSGLLS